MIACKMDTRAKILSVAAAAEQAARVRAEGRHVVLAAGCFDVLQASHARSLRCLRLDGAALFVAVYDDAAACVITGQTRPLLSEQSRAQLVAALGAVDYVLIWPSISVDALLEHLRPDRLEHISGERNIIEEIVSRHAP